MAVVPRVVITGVGPLSSIGIGKEKFWKNILDKKTNIKLEEFSIDDEIWDKYYLHKLEDFDINSFGIEKDKLDDIAEWKEGEKIRDLEYLIASIKLALDDSKIDYRKEDNKIGLVLAHENLGLMPFGLKVSNISYELLIGKKQSEMSKKVFFEKLYKSFIKSGYDVQSFANLFHVARVFNVHEYSLFINNACASGLYAIEVASEIIKNRQAEKVVVAASDFPDIYKYVWFRDLGIYSKDGILRPFSSDANGFVFGDGGAAIVMENIESARKRGAEIYAEYLGGGFDLEGWKITVPQIGGKSYQGAIKKAFDHSGTGKEEIDLLCPHGVGSKPIDYYEANAITDTFGKNLKRPFITTFKPYVGHNLGSSALLETVILLLALRNNTVPPTLNSNNTDPRNNISLVQEKIETKLKTVMKITGAFAGFNSAAIFRKTN